MLLLIFLSWLVNYIIALINGTRTALATAKNCELTAGQDGSNEARSAATRARAQAEESHAAAHGEPAESKVM
jgi:hypothetical protein